MRQKDRDKVTEREKKSLLDLRRGLCLKIINKFLWLKILLETVALTKDHSRVKF